MTGIMPPSHAPFQDVLAKLPGIISLVGNHVLPDITGYQSLGLGDVVLLAPQSGWIARDCPKYPRSRGLWR